MNEDYVTEYKAQTVDGVQTVTFKINPKAAFNDGTPIDVNAVKSYQTIYTAAASGSDYQITPSPIWEQVASVEAVDGDTRHVKVTMSKPWYPIEGSFTSFLHPAFADPKFFNDGLNDKPLDQYWQAPSRSASGTPPPRCSPSSATTSGGARSPPSSASPGVK